MKLRVAVAVVVLILLASALVLMAPLKGKRNFSEEAAVPNEFRHFALPLNNPDTVPASEASHLKDDDIVFGLHWNGKVRAYPRWIMVSFHTVNDTIGFDPILVTQCESCSAAAAFIPVLERFPHRSLIFHGCGRRAGTFEICDSSTASRWHPFTGDATAGPLEGEKLIRVPILTTTWKAWRKQYPDSDVVFASKHLLNRPHGRRSADIGHDFVPEHFAHDANLDDKRLPSGGLVLGIRTRGDAAAVALDSLERKSCWYLLEKQGQNILLYHDGRHGAAGYIFPDELRNSSLASNEGRLVSSEGGSWGPFGTPSNGSKQKFALSVADSYITEWYEWATGNPETEILQAGSCL